MSSKGTQLDFHSFGLIFYPEKSLNADISKIESGKLEFNNENFSFYECVKASHHILINNIKKAKIKFTSIISDEIAPLFIGDELRIRQVLINLLLLRQQVV